MSDSDHSRSDDPYSRVEYRRLIAWERRILREAPLLERLLEEAPDRSVLDLGCGTGEHVAFFAEQGARAVGLDSSPSMLERAREHERAGRGRFVEGDLRDAPAALKDEEPFGLALCLGNVLPHLRTEDDLRAFAGSTAEVLRPGGRLLAQILNYEALLARGDRHLPLNFREGDDGTEIVFLRLLRPDPEGGLLFFPTTLELDPSAETPVTVRSSRRVELRPWTSADLVPTLEGAGFSVALHGDVSGGPFHPEESVDLVLVATLRGS